MSLIAYALCHKLGLKPKISYYKSQGSFAHQVCRVKANNEYYIIDVWANFISTEKDFLSKLKSKIIKWNEIGKNVLNGAEFEIDFDLDEKFKLPKHVLATPDDVSKLKLVNSYFVNGENNIVDLNFF
ncbi:hypothetical protein ABK905_15690 [Acerihabitans sp. KWT182]|uniref:Transglutaminase-like domain-containing protein n=1 Tax=Acerihabitans sp. KWT182 TaxID=3157919 RepID=A0AAU7Q5G4_9GAMM